jgi:archaetidylinositol phosphate synthase
VRERASFGNFESGGLVSASRVNVSFLSRYEQVVLQWLVRRIPAPVTSDMLTLLGFFGAVLAFACYAASAHHPAFLLLSVLGLVIHWFGDSLDGTLARYRKREAPRFGFFVDNMLDAVSQGLFYIGIGVSPYARLDVAALSLCAYYLMVLHTFARMHLIGSHQMSYINFGPTEFRLVIIALTLLMLFVGPAPIRGLPAEMQLYDLLLIGLGLGMIGTFFVQGVQVGWDLKLKDRAAWLAKQQAIQLSAPTPPEQAGSAASKT